MTHEGLPVDFQERLKNILPQEQGLGFERKDFLSLRVNTLKISIAQALELLEKQGIDFKPVDFCPYAVLVARAQVQDFLRSDIMAQGFLYPQGLESLLPVMLLDPQPQERVLDLCAAPGSKTSQIAMLMHNTGFLKANESVRDRWYRLKSVLQLTGAQAQVTLGDGRRLRERAELFDRILVDAPCSSEGRFVKADPKSFKYWSLRKIKEMSHKQKGLLLNASRLLKPGGVLVYATCTFAPEENEEVVDWFLRKTQDSLQLLPTRIAGVTTYPCLTQWQGRMYDARVENALRIYPNAIMEGFFIAKFINSRYK